MNARLVSWPTIRFSIGSIRKPMRSPLTARTLPRAPSRQKITPRDLRDRDGGDRSRLGAERPRPERRDREPRALRGLGFVRCEATFGAGDDDRALRRRRQRGVQAATTFLPEQDRALVRRALREHRSEGRYLVDG